MDAFKLVELGSLNEETKGSGPGGDGPSGFVE